MKRIIIVAVLLTIFTAPVVALQGGPSQPDYLQFEPVDNTDMVNLATGDFTYTIPLGEARAPQGGIPIVLSYHAGIQHDQEATWVGLGWTLNPGAINRVLRGYPDDWKNGVVISQFYDEGEEKSGWGVNVGLGYGPVGVSMTWDSYEGFAGANMSMGIPLGNSMSLGLSAGAAGVGFGLSFKGNLGSNLSGGASIGMKLSPDGTLGGSVGAGISLRGESFAAKSGLATLGGGYSFSSKSSGGSFSIAGTGFSSQSGGQNAGAVQSTNSSSSFSVPIPTPWGLSVSIGAYFWESKWWLNEVVSEHAYGYLYQSGAGIYFPNAQFLDKGTAKPTPPQYADVGAKMDQFETPNHIIFPSQDLYSVSCQGIAGTFKPYGVFDMDFESDVVLRKTVASVYRNSNTPATFLDAPVRWGGKQQLQNQWNPYNKMIICSYEQLNSSTGRQQWLESGIKYRFLNDAGGSFTTMPSPNRYPIENVYSGKKAFTDRYLWENYDIPLDSWDDKAFDLYYEPGISGANTYPRHGSKIILPWFEGDDDGSGTSSGELVGFQIIDNDGKRYNFKRPVYNCWEVSYVTNSANLQSHTLSGKYSKISKSAAYATSWLISEIVGPDYIDINRNGMPDENDCGFWAKFTYDGDTDAKEKSKKHFGYRSPNSGQYNYDNQFIGWTSSNEAQYSCTYGKKEITYLEKIETASDSVVFISSDSRADCQASPIAGPSPATLVSRASASSIYKGKECVSEEWDRVAGHDHKYYMQWASFDVGLPWYLPSNLPSNINLIEVKVNWINYNTLGSPNREEETYYLTAGEIEGIVSEFGFDYGRMVFLVNYYELTTPSKSSGYTPFTMTSISIKITDTFWEWIYPSTTKTKKLEELAFYNKMESSRPYKTVKFGYNYELCGKTPSSSAVASGDGSRQGGRLTLKSVQVMGTDGLAMPPYRFEYGTNPDYYFTTSTTPSASFLGNIFEFHDYWGMYLPSLNKYNKYQSNPTTNANDGVCWNLKKITTPEGGSFEIDLERDRYNTLLFDKIEDLQLILTGADIERRIATLTNQLDYFNINTHLNIDYNDIPKITLYKHATIDNGEGKRVYRAHKNINGITFQTGETERKVPVMIKVIPGRDFIECPFCDACTDNTGDKIYPYESCYNSMWDFNGPHKFIISMITVKPGTPYEIDIPGPFKYDGFFVSIDSVYLIPESAIYGGDVRVKSLKSNNGLGGEVTTYYEYENGYVSRDPAMSEAAIRKRIGKQLFSRYPNISHGPDLISIDTSFYDPTGEMEAPAGGVMYSNVIVSSRNTANEPIDGRTKYEFWTMNDTWNNGQLYNVEKSPGKVVINDYSGIVGRLKAVTKYAWDGSGTAESDFYPIYKDEYHYFQSDGSYSDGTGKRTYSVVRPVNSTQGPTVEIKEGSDGTTQLGARLGATSQKWRSYSKYVAKGSAGYNSSGQLIDPSSKNVIASTSSILKSTTRDVFHSVFNPYVSHINHRTIDAQAHQVDVSVYNRYFDGLTGNPLVTWTQNLDGAAKVVGTLPASYLGCQYDKASTTNSKYLPYIKMYDKNMLSQNYKESVYQDPDGEPTDPANLSWWQSHSGGNNLLSSKVTLWDQFSIDQISQQIYERGTYVARFDATHSYQEMNVPALTFGSGINDVLAGKWIGSTILRYDRYGHPLEDISADGIFSSVLFGYSQSLPIAVATNARLYSDKKWNYSGNTIVLNGDGGYVGFEDVKDVKDFNNNGGWIMKGSISEEVSFTGSKSLLILAGSIEGCFKPNRNGKIVASAWCKADVGGGMQKPQMNITLYQATKEIKDGTSIYTLSSVAKRVSKSLEKNGKWERVQVEIESFAENCQDGIVKLSISSSNSQTYVDDIRVLLEDAKITTFTYDPGFHGVTSITGSDHAVHRYEYDGLGRLIAKKNNNGIITSTGSYYLR